jgi:hypothetical protein
MSGAKTRKNAREKWATRNQRLLAKLITHTGQAAHQAFLLNKYRAEGGICELLRDWHFYRVNKKNNMFYVGNQLHIDVRCKNGCTCV